MFKKKIKEVFPPFMTINGIGAFSTAVGIKSDADYCEMKEKLRLQQNIPRVQELLSEYDNRYDGLCHNADSLTGESLLLLIEACNFVGKQKSMKNHKGFLLSFAKNGQLIKLAVEKGCKINQGVDESGKTVFSLSHENAGLIGLHQLNASKLMESGVEINQSNGNNGFTGVKRQALSPFTVDSFVRGENSAYKAVAAVSLDSGLANKVLAQATNAMSDQDMVNLICGKYEENFPKSSPSASLS